MQRLRFHPLWRPWPLARRAAGWQRSVLLALLGWSLLVAGQLGQLHRYAHLPAEGPHSLVTAAVRAAAPAAPHSSEHEGWLAHLFGHHLELNCQLLDQLVHGSAPGTEPALWLAHAAPSDQLPVWRAFPATEPRRAAYDARAPPLRA